MGSPESPAAIALGSIPAVFREVAARYATQPALEGDGTVLTFAELDRLTNRVAHHFLERGGNEPIAALGSIEPASLVLAYGALKAGRIWSPLDPRDPPERTRALVEHLGAVLVRPEQLDGLLSDQDDDPELELDPFGPAIVYFTSGSTGGPKGAVKCHREFIWLREVCETEPGDRFALVVPLAFTASYLPVFGGLLGGATVCCFDPTLHGIGSLGAWLDEAAVTLLFAAPSVLRGVGTEMETRGRRADSVRLAVVAGEPCRGVDLDAPRRAMPHAAVINLYGSSEAGAIATTRIPPGEPVGEGPIPLRRVCPWLSIEIVDPTGRPVPAGDVGDIRVRGREVSLGYWDDPEQTAARFLPAPHGERIVVTGDRGRFGPEGALEHLGRSDLRVKVRGQMVDPEEVEHALAALPQVQAAIVSPVPGQGGDTTLVAHVVPEAKAKPTSRELRLALAHALPPYMIPAAFLLIAAVPRNERGKIDREALRQAALNAGRRARDYEAPRTAGELALVEILAEVLAVERAGVHEDFFELGIDSFNAVELLAAIEERFGVDLAIADLLERPTAAALAERLDGGSASADRLLLPLHTGGTGTPFFVVAGGGGAGMLALRRLGARLDRPLYSFIPRGFLERALPDRTVERAAERFVSGLRGIQPSGPYLIGGYSFGGLVAFEISQQLQAAGEAVALLVLLDPATSDAGQRERVQWIAGGRGRYPTSPVSATRRMVRHAGMWIADAAILPTAGIIERSQKHQQSIFFRLNLRMSRRYRPRPYGGEALVLRTKRWKSLDRLDLGGTLLTGEKRLVAIPGTHNTMLLEPHGATVGALLREAFAAADPG